MSHAARIFKNMVSLAKCHTMIGYPPELRIKHAIRDGKPIPDFAKPGYLLTQLSPDDREALAELTSDETRRIGWMEAYREQEAWLAVKRDQERRR